jgi:hypothetical protein
MVTTVTRPRAQGYGALIGDDYFRVAPDNDVPLRIHTKDSLAQRSDQRGSPEENVLEIGYVFSRSNLTGGEGLDWWPRQSGEREIPTDPIRFWDSSNIDIRRPEAGFPYTLELVPNFVNFWTPGGTPVDMGTSRDSIFVIHGTTVARFDDWGDTTAEDTDNIGVTLTQIAVGPDGSVAVLDNTGEVWFKGSQTDTYILVYDTATDGDEATGVWWVKDRIIIATNDPATATQGALVEFLPTMGGTPAAPTAVPASYDTFDTFEGECYDVVDAGHAIVAAFSDGSIRSYVPQSDTAGGVPVLTIRARTQVPTGEVAYRLGHNLGSLMIFTVEEIPSSTKTTVRLYLATVLDERFDYVVGALQLVRVWENTVQTVPAYTQNIVSTRDEVFFAIPEATNTWNLWRLDLVTTGLFRHAAPVQTGMLGLVFFDGIVGWLEGGDVVIEDTTTLATDGYVIMPNITFGLNTPINWVAFTIDVLGLETGGTKVELYRSTDATSILDPDDPGWVLVASLTDPAQSGLEEAIIKTTSKQLALMIKLYSSTNGLISPVVNRTAVRGLPKHRDWIVDIPINVSDMVEAPGRMPLRVPGWGNKTHTKLVSLQGASTTIVVFDPPITIRGVVETILEPTAYITHRGSQGRRCIVRCLGVLVGTDPLAAVQGTEGLGISTLGIGTLGIGEVT